MMKIDKNEIELTTLHDQANFQIVDLDSEIRADHFCSTLLKHFHQHLLQGRNLEPLEAGSQAAGADYFLREYMIGKRRENIYNATAERVLQFAGNWYIISNLEPNMEELTAILRGTASFYHYCAEYNLTTIANSEQIEQTCDKTDYFQHRIEDFHNISGDGYNAWVKACPL